MKWVNNVFKMVGAEVLTWRSHHTCGVLPSRSQSYTSYCSCREEEREGNRVTSMIVVVADMIH